VNDRPHSAFILISAYNHTLHFLTLGLSNPICIPANIQAIGYMTYVCEDVCVCQDAFDACTPASLFWRAPSFGPLFVCVFVWHESWRRKWVLAIRRDVCPCYCALTLPYPSYETQSTHPTLALPPPTGPLLPTFQWFQSIRHTMKSGCDKCFASSEGWARGSGGGWQSQGSAVFYNARDQCLPKLVTVTRSALHGKI